MVWPVLRKPGTFVHSVYGHLTGPATSAGTITEVTDVTPDLPVPSSVGSAGRR